MVIVVDVPADFLRFRILCSVQYCLDDRPACRSVFPFSSVFRIVNEPFSKLVNDINGKTRTIVAFEL